MPPVKRHSYTASYKLGVIKYAEEHGNHAAGRHFDIGGEAVPRLAQEEGKATKNKKVEES